MEFLAWLYVKHWFIGMFFFPEIGIAWNVWTGHLWLAFFCVLSYISGRTAGRIKR
jgi:hypothetical protein